MTPATATLSDPLVLPCGATLPNRLAKAAMSEQLARRDGATTPRLRRLYEVWGRSGAGLLVTGNVMVDRDALTEPGNVLVTDGRDLAGLREWASAAQQGGSRVWMQINHPGRVAVTPFDRRPVAPSALRSGVPGYNLRRPRELGAEQVRQLVGRFARTAELAVAAGFDGVQVHAAHGYLLSQFLSPLANRRDDEYGGDAARRSRLLLEVVAAVRAAVGPQVPVGVKLNSQDFVRGGFEPDASVQVALALAEAGVDLLEISGGGYEAPAMTGVVPTDPGPGQEGYFERFAGRLRAETSMPIMLTGGLRSPEHLQALVGAGTVDVVGLGRPLAFTPTFPARILAGESPTLPRHAPRVGYRPLDGYLELAWHNAQLHRIATGRTPQRRPGLRTLLRSGLRIVVGALRQVRVPR